MWAKAGDGRQQRVRRAWALFAKESRFGGAHPWPRSRVLENTRGRRRLAVCAHLPSWPRVSVRGLRAPFAAVCDPGNGGAVGGPSPAQAQLTVKGQAKPLSAVLPGTMFSSPRSGKRV